MMKRLQSGSSKEHTTRRFPDYYQENQGVEGFYYDYNYYGDSDTYPDIPPPPHRPQNHVNDYFEKAFQAQAIKQQWTAQKHGNDYIEVEEAFQEQTTGNVYVCN